MSGRTGVIASEEEDTPVAVEETTSGNYIVVFDPLDGSSNIDAGELQQECISPAVVNSTQSASCLAALQLLCHVPT